MTKTKAQTQKGRGATGGGQIARMYRAIRECPWPEIAQGPRGGPLAKAVMLTLATYADADGGSVWPGDELVSDKIGASRIAVARMRRNLMEVGVLARERAAHWRRLDSGRRKRYRAEYRINVEMLEALAAEDKVWIDALAAINSAAFWDMPEGPAREAARQAACEAQFVADNAHDARLAALRARLAPGTATRVVSPPSRPAASAS